MSRPMLRAQTRILLPYTTLFRSYRNTIMKDAALARRFNDVTINEPSKDATVAILKGLRKSYEDHHHVKLPEDRKSTRLNSSHVSISYAVFCLKKKINNVIT